MMAVIAGSSCMWLKQTLLHEDNKKDLGPNLLRCGVCAHQTYQPVCLYFLSRGTPLGFNG